MIRSSVHLITFVLCAVAAVPSWGGTLFVAHGGGTDGAAQGGVIGKIDLNTFAYTPLTGSLGSLTTLIYDGTSLWTYETQTDEFLRVDPVTGAVLSSVSRVGGGDPTDMAYDPTTGKTYASAWFGGVANLYEVNLGTGQMSVLGDLYVPLEGNPSLAFSPGGVLYQGSNGSTFLHTVDKTDGSVLTTVGMVGTYGALGLEFDGSNGQLYTSHCCPAGELGESLWRVDPTTGSATLLIDFNDERRMQDFALVETGVPEPATTALMGAGLAALAVLRRRRK